MEIDKSAFLSPMDIQFFKNHLRNSKDCRSIVAEIGGQVVGYPYFTIRFLLPHSRIPRIFRIYRFFSNFFEFSLIVGTYIAYAKFTERSEIQSFAVDEKYRNQKIGSILLAYCICYLIPLGKPISLHVNVHNTIALNMYKKYPPLH